MSPRLRLALAASLVVAGVASVTRTHQADALPSGEILALVDEPLDGLVATWSSESPDHGVISDGVGTQMRWTFTTDEFVDIPAGDDWSSLDVRLGVTGQSGWVPNGSPGEFVRIDLATGTTKVYTVPFSTADWTVTGVSTGSVPGVAGTSLVFVQATNVSTGADNSFLFDLGTETIVGGGPYSKLGTSSGGAISAEGNLITYAEAVLVGGDPTFKQWNRATDTHSELTEGEYYVAIGRPWSTRKAPDGTWYRAHVTGAEVVLPIDNSTIKRADVTSTGRVLILHEVTTPERPAALQLSYWDGAGPAVLVSEAVDGSPADFGIDVYFAYNRDASIIAFTSRSPDLPPALSDPPAARRLYKLDLRRAPDGGPVIGPSEERCAAAVGAEPGDYVSVNITPILATTAGHGTMHSSDTSAGRTSNVNFGPGTVDPNTAIVQVGTDGNICFTNSNHGPVHLVLDQLTVIDPSIVGLPTPSGAARLTDTRTDSAGVIRENETRCAAAVGAEPGDYVSVNITPILATTAGHGTMHSSDTSAGRTSNVNFGPGTVDPNTAIVQVGTDGNICFTNSNHGPVHLVLDQLTVIDPSIVGLPTPSGAARLTDTRL